MSKQSIMEQLTGGVRSAVEAVKAPAKELANAIGEDVQALRESTFAKGVDNVIEATDKFLGPSGKAWMANGLDELRQAVALGAEQVQGGNNPGLWGTITTGEATAERLAGDRGVEGSLNASFEVPKQVSLEEMRGMAKENAQQDKGMERSQENDKGMER